jgi:hypothetical protein
MKTLYLLGHAKSSWKDRGLDDLDRPLNKRGRETAKTMAAYLRRAKITPDLVLCSTAVRAKQTLEPIAKAIKLPRVAFESLIYGIMEAEAAQSAGQGGYSLVLPRTGGVALHHGSPAIACLAEKVLSSWSIATLPPAVLFGGSARAT